MQRLTDKLILFFLCFLPMIWSGEAIGLFTVAAFLAALAASSLGSILEERYFLGIGVLYCLLALWRKEFLLFLPPIAYDCAREQKWQFRFPWTVSLLAYAGMQEPGNFFATLLFCGAGYLLCVRTAAYEKALGAYFQMQDTTREQALYLEKKNRELLDKQDYEVRLATLNERNRIAREIHDNVGHLLTRSILQLGAMTVVHRQEEALSGELTQVKDTLSEAMDSIRESVHNLHDEAVDLELQLRKLTEAFEFCPVAFHYKAGRLPPEISYNMIAIVKEGLSNIARHSNATWAEVSVVEHPAVCQLVIRDNGTKAEQKRGREHRAARTANNRGMQACQEYPAAGGIGLQNIRERAEALGGNFRVDYENGFRLFASFPLPGCGL